MLPVCRSIGSICQVNSPRLVRDRIPTHLVKQWLNCSRVTSPLCLSNQHECGEEPEAHASGACLLPGCLRRWVAVLLLLGEKECRWDHGGVLYYDPTAKNRVALTTIEKARLFLASAVSVQPIF